MTNRSTLAQDGGQVEDPIDAAIEDEEVTDAQLGALVRQYKGLTKSPKYVVVRPSYWEKAIILAVLALLGAMVFRFFWDNAQREQTRDKIEVNTYVTCDMMDQLNLDVPNECPAEATR